MILFQRSLLPFVFSQIYLQKTSEWNIFCLKPLGKSAYDRTYNITIKARLNKNGGRTLVVLPLVFLRFS